MPFDLIFLHRKEAIGLLFDELAGAGRYSGLPGVGEALEFLRGLGPKAHLEGQAELGGGRIRANPVQLTTRAPAECRYEAHRRYLDLHYTVSGVERISVRPVEGLEPLAPFDAGADIGFYSGAPGVDFLVGPGQFLVCWPGEAHQVGMMAGAPGPVEKIVVKIPAGYLPAAGRRILVFGDSNTYGYAPATGGRYTEAERYPRLLQNLLGPGVCVIEEGLPGRTCVFRDPLTEGLCGLDAITPLMNSHMPIDTLVVMLGTNDCKERFGANSYLIAKGLARLLEKAKATPAWRAEPDILVVCPTPIIPAYERLMFAEEMGAGCSVRAAGLAAEFERVAAAAGCRFVDAGRIPGVAVHEADGMHLTAAAHAALANALAGLLK